MNDDPEDLAAISRTTLGHYEANAADYEASTRDHDVLQNIAALTRHIEGPRPWTLLDFGCGPGRDLATLTSMGHVAIGLDGSEAFVQRARAATGATVWHQNFFDPDLPASHFDGVFANASMQHVPGVRLPSVLRALHATLKPRGVFFASIPHGDDEEGWNGQRYGRYHDPESWRRHLTNAGFEELEHYFRPEGLPRDQQRWFASAWRRA